MSLTNLTQIARSKGDPRIERTGHSSLTDADRLARALGWFSIGLGVAELLAAGPIARMLGLDDKEGLIRAFGARELASAVSTLSVDKPAGLASRIAGDALDLATLSPALHRDNPKRNNAAIATALVVGITLLDLIAFSSVKAAHSRERGSERDFRPQRSAAGCASLPRPCAQGLRDAAGLSGGGHVGGRAAGVRVVKLGRLGLPL